MTKIPDAEPISWVSDFEVRPLDELLKFVWSYHPGDIAKVERPDKANFEFPSHLNVISIGPQRSGKSSYMNSLLSIINPDCEITQIYSELGSDTITGTVRLEGPYCLNDYSTDSSLPRRTFCKLWTTMGVPTDGIDTEKQFMRVIKDCFLGKIRPGDYTGLLEQPCYNPIIKRSPPDVDVTKYHLAFITARYGVAQDAEMASNLYSLLSKHNGIPTVVLVTHSNDHDSWDLINGIDKGSLFFIENYLPKELVKIEKSKKLLIPLLEAIKKVERSDMYWSKAGESTVDVVIHKIDEFANYLRKDFHIVVIACLAVLVLLLLCH